MNRFLTFLTVVIVLALVRAVVAALVVATALLLLFSFVVRPRQTLVFLGALTFFGLATARPLACIVASATVALAVLVSARARGRGPLGSRLWRGRGGDATKDKALDPN